MLNWLIGLRNGIKRFLALIRSNDRESGLRKNPFVFISVCIRYSVGRIIGSYRYNLVFKTTR